MGANWGSVREVGRTRFPLLLKSSNPVRILLNRFIACRAYNTSAKNGSSDFPNLSLTHLGPILTALVLNCCFAFFCVRDLRAVPHKNASGNAKKGNFSPPDRPREPRVVDGPFVPLQEMGKLAAEIVLRRVAAGPYQRLIVVDPTRHSTIGL
jgi:hypothetical protein